MTSRASPDCGSLVVGHVPHGEGQNKPLNNFSLTRTSFVRCAGAPVSFQDDVNLIKKKKKTNSDGGLSAGTKVQVSAGGIEGFCCDAFVTGGDCKIRIWRKPAVCIIHTAVTA